MLMKEHLRAAIVGCLDRPVTITLPDGTSRNTKFAALLDDGVLLAGGGFISFDDLRSFIPLPAGEAQGSTDFSDRERAGKETASPQPETAGVDESSTAPERKESPKESNLLQQADSITESGLSHAIYEPDDKQQKRNVVYREVNRRYPLIGELTELEKPFAAQIREYTWQRVPVPTISNKSFPKDAELAAIERKKALHYWSKAVDFASNSNWGNARSEFLEVALMLPTTIEPVLGCAYAATQQGDFVYALAILRYRSHLIPADSTLAKATVSLAIQLGAIPLSLHLLRSFSPKSKELAWAYILTTCRYGLYRKAINLLSDEPSLWAALNENESLSAYLLARLGEVEPEIVDSHYREWKVSVTEPTLSLLISNLRDRPTEEFERSTKTDTAIGSEIERHHDVLRDLEQAQREAGKVGCFENLIEKSRARMDFNEAVSAAIEALNLSKSNHWKKRYRSLIEELRKEAETNRNRALSVGHPRPFVNRYSRGSNTTRAPRRVPIRSNVTPAQQAADAAERGELDLAIRLYKKHLSSAVSGTWDEMADRALNGLAMVYQRLGQREQAIKVMLEYRDKVKAPFRFHNQLATLFFVAREYESAEENFTRAADLATSPADKQKAVKNARNARERARSTTPPDSVAEEEYDEFVEELVREYWEIDFRAPVRMREVSLEIEPFLKPDIDRLVQDGAEIIGIERVRVVRGDFDYESVFKLIQQGSKSRRAQGVRSQLLASALYLIYQKNWHQNAEAVQRLDPLLTQTRFAQSLGEDASAQNRPAVAREYYACVLERNPHRELALAMVRSYIRTFTGEVFIFGEEKYKFTKFVEILEDDSIESHDTLAEAVWGILHIANLSLPAYTAILEVIEEVAKDPFQIALKMLFPALEFRPGKLKANLDTAMRYSRSYTQKIEDQFHSFTQSTRDGPHTLDIQCREFMGIDADISNNPIDFGQEGRVIRWRNGLIAEMLRYFSTAKPAEKELRFKQVMSQLDLARQDIIDHPTRFGRRVLLQVVENWNEMLRRHFEDWEQTVAPEFEIQCLQVLETADGKEVELKISNALQSRTAYELQLDLEIAGCESRPATSADGKALEGGGEEPISWYISKLDSEIVAGSIPAIAHVSHLDRQGKKITIDIPLEIPMNPIPYRDIHNPYDPGPPVTRDEMLKGRGDLVERLVHAVSDPAKCSFFRIIGARRVGKSSILEAALRRLRGKDNIIATGRIDVNVLGSSQPIETILQTWASQLCADARRISHSICEWEWNQKLPPTEDFLRWVENQIRPVAHPVLLLDEFQSIANLFDDDTLSNFLGFWKAMIERRLISGIICGVDSMDDLISGRGFGNQFASIKTEKVDFLSTQAARELIEQPILLPYDLPEPFEHLREKSRYSAGAVKEILDLTAASPYYIQLFCDNVVHKLNDDKNMLVTEMTVRKALRLLMDRWDFATYFENLTRFNPTHLTDNTRDKEIEGRILYSIALETQDRYFTDVVKSKLARWPRGFQEDSYVILNQLVKRGVVVPNDDGNLHRIRIGLFKLWLQNNRVFGDDPSPSGDA
jgi:tetratricopeptide (TPR) repeat protein